MSSCLLTNVNLSSTKSLYYWSTYTPEARIGRKVHPKILQTCRQISTKASEVLYGSNDFIFAFNHRDLTQNPILDHVEHAHESLDSYPWLKKVKSWKLVLSIWAHPSFDELPNISIVDFCRAITGGEVQRLNILLLPQGESVHAQSRTGKPPSKSPHTRNFCPDIQIAGRYHDIDVFLSPFRLLRGLKSVGFGEIAEDEIPCHLEQPSALTPNLFL